MTLDIIDARLKATHSLPDDFHFYRYMRGPEGVPCADSFYTQVWGACCPLFKTGKRAGKPNWRKKVKSTVRTFVVRDSQYESWVADWELTTGKCSRCAGSGKTVAGLSTSGLDYRPCGKCKGTGAA
jgi:hypothetical protein